LNNKNNKKIIITKRIFIFLQLNYLIDIYLLNIINYDLLVIKYISFNLAAKAALLIVFVYFNVRKNMNIILNNLLRKRVIIYLKDICERKD